MSISIRPATPEDAYAIASIHVKTWQTSYAGLIPISYLDSLSVIEREYKWREMLTKNTDQTIHLVGLQNDTIVGWSSFCKCRDDDAQPEWGELGGIYVSPKVQGLGIGKKLMAEGLAQLKKQGYQKATLWVLANNEKAKAFYESHNWKVEGKKKVEHREGFDLHEVRYIADLKSLT